MDVEFPCFQPVICDLRHPQDQASAGAPLLPGASGRSFFIASRSPAAGAGVPPPPPAGGKKAAKKGRK